MDKIARNTYFHSIDEFQLLDRKRLGKGSFGEVRLAIHLQTNKTYAIKIIERKDMTSQVASKALERQITIHSSLTHPHIVRLWQVLRDEDRIYLIMEYAEKGNLFYYQNEKKVFSQEEASIFFTQTLSAVQYLHNLNLVHRDLKPQNLLLDKDYNIKICDLGWVIEGVNDTHHTFCGTYQYMAPEMIFDREYNYRIDVWALGVLIYQLLHGFAPFEGETVDEVRQSMIAGEIHIDPDLSANVQNLIFGILKVNPEQRLTFEAIRCHPWVKQMNAKRMSNISSTILKNSFEKQNQSLNRSKPRLATLQSKTITVKPDLLSSLGTQLESNKTLLCLKQRKNLQARLKSNVSLDQLKHGRVSKQKTKSKENIYKYLKQMEKKKRESGGHKTQNSNFSQIIKNPRMKTQANEKNKQKNEMIRYGTQIGQIYETFGSSIGHKKRKVGHRKQTQTSNMLKKAQKGKNIRQSID